jgi:hypothetical protein
MVLNVIIIEIVRSKTFKNLFLLEEIVFLEKLVTSDASDKFLIFNKDRDYVDRYLIVSLCPELLD